GDQHAPRVEAGELGAALGPAERGERPQGGGEPGVEHVLILAQGNLGTEVMVRAPLGLGATHVTAAGAVVPGRDAVSPPQLAADTPVLDVAHPLEVGARPILRHEARAAVLD